MEAISKRQAARVARAAELRATGTSWEEIGRQLGCRAETCRRWLHEYPMWWAHSTQSAQRELYRTVRQEAETVLRHLLRSADRKVRLDAAATIREAAERDPTAMSPTARAEAEIVRAEAQSGRRG